MFVYRKTCHLHINYIFALFTVPPEIRPLSNITANEGDDEVLSCTASGFPLPTVVWFKDNEEYPGQLVGSYMQCVLRSLDLLASFTEVVWLEFLNEN